LEFRLITNLLQLLLLFHDFLDALHLHHFLGSLLGMGLHLHFLL